ncbi:MAG TPA: DUF1592 domain-containing protein [Bryobacteraceae bacterium]|nr:DUF1592 domain-containing protein [Bryobacteraceae bacterium]
MKVSPLVGLALGAAWLMSVDAQAQSPANKPSGFETTVQPFLAKNCYGCHNTKVRVADLDVQAYKTEDAVLSDRDRWEHILEKIETQQMPPKGSPRPDAADRKAVTEWIQAKFEAADKAAKPNPGRVTARRLNRAEYNNTVRDLLGVDLKPADAFPPDDSGYGFDNIGDALSLSPVLMEKYMTAAETVTRAALFGLPAPQPTVIRHQPPYRLGLDGGDNTRTLALLPYTITNYDLTGLSMPSALHTTHRFPATADYVFRVSPEGNRPRPSDPFEVAIWIDGKQAASLWFEAATVGTGMEGFDQEVKIRVTAGDHAIAVSPLRIFEGLPAKYGGLKPTAKAETEADTRPFTPPPPPADATPEEKAEFERRRAAFGNRARRPQRPPSVADISFRVNFVEVKGPFDADTKPSDESRKKVLVCGHLDGKHAPACARTILTAFARKAYRRNVSEAEIAKLLKIVEADRKAGDSFEEAIAIGLQAVLVSPNFLFRVEKDPVTPVSSGDRLVSQYELATRLAYFLWSTTPDDQLLRLAGQGRLRAPGVLEAQVRRMLKDPRSHALIENFGGQWLQFRALESHKPDVNKFPHFDNYVRTSMQKETEMLFANIIQQDRPITEFLDANYTFLNQRLAEFYGMKGITGPEFRRVELSGTNRGGVITHGSVLTVSSYTNRTSVVLRGKYILENILNAPVPPPPPNVPALDEMTTGSKKSMREAMEEHRQNPVCASCHSRMDPLGFGLENFDAVGAWRTEDGKFAIDNSGTLPDGRSFKGPAGLRELLANEKDAFTHGMVDKMLTYALGRGLERFDRPVVKRIATSVAENNYRFSALILQIVNSLPFQKTAVARAS